MTSTVSSNFLYVNSLLLIADLDGYVDFKIVRNAAGEWLDKPVMEAHVICQAMFRGCVSTLLGTVPNIAAMRKWLPTVTSWHTRSTPF